MKILCLGDSLTDCNRMFSENPLGDGYAAMLHDCLENKDKNYVFINRGVDGFTVSRLLDNTRSQYLSLRPDRITILIGINDAALIMNTNRTSEQKKIMMNTFLEKYEELIRLLRISVKEILLMEPFIFPHPAEFDLWKPVLKTMSEGIRSLSMKYSLDFLPLQSVLDEASASEGFPAITIDGVHLTKKGQRILAEQIKNWIFPVTD